MSSRSLSRSVARTGALWGYGGPSWPVIFIALVDEVTVKTPVAGFRTVRATREGMQIVAAHPGAVLQTGWIRRFRSD